MWKFLLIFLFFSIFPSAMAADQISPASEQKAVLAYLDKIPAEDKEYIWFWTTYAIPKELKKDGENALQYIVNSNAHYESKGYINKLQRVPNSDTLWWADIREYNWSTSDIGEVFKLQPYFLNPLVDGQAKLFRADWFIIAASENTYFKDRGGELFAHYILTYGKGKEPKDANEFKKIWQVDEKTLKIVQRGAIVDHGNSGVSRHARQALWARTAYGQFSATKDVKSHDLDPDKFQERDYLEDFFASYQDAGEYIVNHVNGLQVYFLTLGTKDKFKRIEDADVGIVIDYSDKNDPRVRTFSSCIGCHIVGHNPVTDDFRKFFENGPDLYTKHKEFLQLIKAFYFRDKDENIEDANKIFERAVKSCNGLTTIENAKAYMNVIKWYKEKVTLEQAAIECGVNKEELKAKLKGGLKARIVGLFHDKAIPRDVWDSTNGGGYIQSMLLIKGINQTEKLLPAKPPIVVEEPEIQLDKLEVVKDNAKIINPRDGSTVVLLAKGLIVNVHRKDGSYYYVSYTGKYGLSQGFMRKEDLGK